MSAYTFFITSLIIILIPGTGVIYTISVGISKGKKASVLAALSCTAGIVPHLCVSIVLSSLLLNMSNEVFTAMKLAGALYLLYLGAGMIFSKTKLDFENDKLNNSPITIIRRGILINLLNPKLTLFFFSFLPQYVSSNGTNYVFQSFIFGSPRRISVLQKCFGIIFVIFAVQLAM